MRNDWFKIKQITKSIYAIDDRGEDILYLVVGKEKALLVDTGWGVGNLKKVVSTITDLPLIVVNTHGHPDHVSGDYQFSEIHIAEGDVPVLQQSFKEENRRWALENVLRGPFPDDFSAEQWLYSELPNIIPIKDKHLFDLGNKIIEVIEVPGHSPGCIVLIDHEERVLFSGDSILKGYTWLHLDHSTTLSKYLLSLKKLKTEMSKFDAILPAHSDFPLQAEIISEFISGAEDILEGRRKGIAHQTFAGDGLLCTFGSCGIVYNSSRL
ncbi:MAG: MBL fold metallo-hydrolase [Clostridia bacterium]|nr:MBL fold metallo-hydrolase [Clostridia bacterium]